MPFALTGLHGMARQQTLNTPTDWAKEWMVTMDRTKTEATCFSFCPKKEDFNIRTDGHDVPPQYTPIQLGQISHLFALYQEHGDHTLRKLALMKNWPALVGEQTQKS